MYYANYYVRWGGWSLGEKIKNEELGENMKREENYIKNGVKDLKNASFWV